MIMIVIGRSCAFKKTNFDVTNKVSYQSILSFLLHNFHFSAGRPVGR